MSRSKIAALENLPKKPQSPDDLQPGESVCAGRFEIEARLGAGGVATVYRAKDATRSCTVALKVLHQARAEDPRELQRFRNEIEINEGIGAHPNLLQPFETGTIDEDGRPFLLSERGKGPTLESLIIFAPLEESRALDLFEQIATGLGHMHEAGVLHRDVKPSNVIVEKGNEGGSGDEGSSERARLFDFGYAIAQKDLCELPPQARLTQAGEIPGTKHYMAPEQVLGLPASPASDVYALGVSLYEALTGSPPYVDLEPADAAIRKATAGNRVPDISTKGEGGISTGIAALVMDALEPDPKDRIRNTRAFVARIRAIRDGGGAAAASEPAPAEPDPAELAPSSRRPLLVFIGVVSAFFLIFLVIAFVRHRPHTLSPIGLEIPSAARAVMQAPSAADNPPSVDTSPSADNPPELEPEPAPDPEPEAEPSTPEPEPAPDPKTSPEPQPEIDGSPDHLVGRVHGRKAQDGVSTSRRPAILRALRPSCKQPCPVRHLGPQVGQQRPLATLLSPSERFWGPLNSQENQIDCEAERTSAAHASQWDNWRQLKKHTKHAKCWNSRLEWEVLRVKALHKTGNDAACRKLARKSKTPLIQRWATICSSTPPTETPQ